MGYILISQIYRRHANNTQLISVSKKKTKKKGKQAYCSFHFIFVQQKWVFFNSKFRAWLPLSQCGAHCTNEKVKISV